VADPRLLDGYRFEPEIEILDGGTLGLSLASYLADTDRLIVIDAVASAAAPGTVVVLRDGDVPATIRASLSAHEASLCDLLAALTLIGSMPGEFVAVGIVPLATGPSIELSGPVRAALPEAEDAVLAQLARWGIAAESLGVPHATVLTL
jgi:hydrogenase maturation protease